MFREIAHPSRNAMQHLQDRLNGLEYVIAPLLPRIGPLEDMQKDTRMTTVAHGLRLCALERSMGIEKPGGPAQGSEQMNEAVTTTMASGPSGFQQP